MAKVETEYHDDDEEDEIEYRLKADASYNKLTTIHHET